MSRIVALIDAIDRLFVIVAEIALFILMALIFVSITGRTLINTSIPDRTIITEILMVAIVFLTLGNVQKIRGHIEVTALADLLPAGVNNALRVFALLLAIAVFGGSAWFSAKTAIAAYERDALIFSSVLDLKRWPGLVFVPLGLGWWCLRMAVQLFEPAARATSGADHVQERIDQFD